MRGKHALYDSLDWDAPVTVLEKSGKRNPMIGERDQLMVTRFYYYSRLHGYRHEKSLQLLSKDIFLDPESDYMPDRISMHRNLLLQLIEDDVQVPELRRQYPNFNWTV